MSTGRAGIESVRPDTVPVPLTDGETMAEKHRTPEQETQHDKKQAATQENPVDPKDAEGTAQETQHVKKQAARQPEQKREGR